MLFTLEWLSGLVKSAPSCKKSKIFLLYIIYFFLLPGSDLNTEMVPTNDRNWIYLNR